MTFIFCNIRQKNVLLLLIQYQNVASVSWCVCSIISVSQWKYSKHFDSIEGQNDKNIGHQCYLLLLIIHRQENSFLEHFFEGVSRCSRHVCIMNSIKQNKKYWSENVCVLTVELMYLPLPHCKTGLTFQYGCTESLTWWWHWRKHQGIRFIFAKIFQKIEIFSMNCLPSKLPDDNRKCMYDFIS